MVEEKKLYSINLIFENCEEIEIPSEYINSISIWDLKKQIVGGRPDRYFEHEIADDVVIKLDQSIDKLKYFQFGIKDMEEKVMPRLFHNDITAINIKTINNSNVLEEKYIHVVWNDENVEFVNDYQTTQTDYLGNVVVEIHKKIAHN